MPKLIQKSSYLKSGGRGAGRYMEYIATREGVEPAVAVCHAVWNRLRDEAESYYKDAPREHLPLSWQKEFKAIKNAVIREAENIRLGVAT